MLLLKQIKSNKSKSEERLHRLENVSFIGRIKSPMIRIRIRMIYFHRKNEFLHYRKIIRLSFNLSKISFQLSV